MLTGGLEWTRNALDIRIFERPNRSFPGVAEAITEHLQTDEDNVGAFAEVWWELTPGVAAYGSLRYDYVRLPVRDLLDPTDSGENTFSEASGGFGVSGDIGGEISLFAGYGRGFRAPVILEVTCSDPEDPCQLPFELGPDPPLEPVKSDSWQAGLRLGRERVRASLVGYWTEVHDDIFNIVDEDTPTRGYFTNLDRTRRTGVEVSALGRPLDAIPGLEVHGSFAWTRATFQTNAVLASPLVDDDPPDPGDPVDDEGPTEVEPGDRFPMVPEYSATLGGTYRIGAFSAGAEASWIGRQYLVGDEGNEEEFDRLAPSTVVDLHAEYRWASATAFLEVANVFDNDYAAFGIVSENARAATEQVERFLTPGAPRHITVGLRVTLWGATEPAP
jgi:outer membrane receptor protein involved in Fe transport